MGRGKPEKNKGPPWAFGGPVREKLEGAFGPYARQRMLAPDELRVNSLRAVNGPALISCTKPPGLLVVRGLKDQGRRFDPEAASRVRPDSTPMTPVTAGSCAPLYGTVSTVPRQSSLLPCGLPPHTGRAQVITRSGRAGR